MAANQLRNDQPKQVHALLKRLDDLPYNFAEHASNPFSQQ
jgi:hypothetical protein